MSELNLQLITQAANYLSGRIYETPVEYSPLLSKLHSQPTWLKLESLQVTGSFKARGALFRLAQLNKVERQQGIVTISAGNHGRAVAYAARELGIRATVYVPATVDEVKYQGMLALGADVIRSDFPGYDDTQAWALEEIKQSGKTFISAFDDPWIMAANGGSLAIEVIQAVPEAKTFVLPVSGGGLSAGFAYYVKERIQGAQFIGCQHRESPGLAMSLERGKAVTTLPPIDTVAGGLEGGIGTTTFPVLRERTDQVVLVSEAEIYAAVRWMLDNHQYLIEPSAAATVAAGLSSQFEAQGPTVIVLSGRNVSLETLKKILDN